jgi:hypothetical protein
LAGELPNNIELLKDTSLTFQVKVQIQNTFILPLDVGVLKRLSERENLDKHCALQSIRK